MAYFKTIGEVSKETGIKVREIKYYIESEFFIPSHKVEQGNKTIWNYSKEDIRKIQQIKLYKELDYSNSNIKKIINADDFDWDEALSKQIHELREKKRHLENLIMAAEFMRFFKEIENESNFDISDFDNDIDTFSNNIFSPEIEENTEQGIMQLGEEITSNMDIDKLNFMGEQFIKCFESFVKISNNEPTSDSIQSWIDTVLEIIGSFVDRKQIDLKEILFGIRFLICISPDRFLEMLVGKPDLFIFIEKALEEYIKRSKEENYG
ncbi:MerR family transcriptional regulator [Longibaculum muris]|uniref:MerR family transcriptional regulator n=1 Tax=Longibaculum muris TaxID=1796628 RepID=UPI0022E1BE5E|nr:MerR family transcriptional regulator [Longibaculum muris]